MIVRSAVRFSAVLIALGFTTACPPPAKPPPPKPVERAPSFTFDLAEPKSDAPANVTVALIRPTWKLAVADDQKVLDLEGLSKKFSKALGTGFEDMLTHRGFSIGGPFDSLDDMTFPDKKGSDLALVFEISIDLKMPKFTRKDEVTTGFGGGQVEAHYFMTGAAVASGFISFRVLEPLSGQKVWVKKVDLAELAVNCGDNSAYSMEPLQTIAKNCATAVLEQAYPTIMKKAATYFTRDEMDAVKKQSQELRDKKTY
ncbi:MAG: HpaA family protein [Polyangiales bacterium]